jgi:hypothetical protein
MSEAEWVELIASRLRELPWWNQEGLSLPTGLKIPYGCEILSYGPEGASPEPKTIGYETDLAVIQKVQDQRWKPRVVVEAKLGSITTHDAITYSQKAAAHREVHPYLRYGIMLGDRQHYPLPGRLYRHGTQFDFMISFRGTEPSEAELTTFVEVLQAEVAASRILEKILYESRRKGRDQYTVLHRKLILK